MSNIHNKVFKQTVAILTDSHIHYWVTDGSLLGIIRENRLLPWDSDIDFAIWKHEHSKMEIIKLFELHGYKLLKTLPNMDCLHFIIDNVQVDIGFYTYGINDSCIKWATSPKNIFLRYYLSLVSIMFEMAINGKNINDFKFKNNFFKYSVSILMLVVVKLIPNRFLNSLFDKASGMYVFAGSCFSNHLMKFTQIYFLETAIVIPVEAEKHLELTYGINWKIPNKDYKWESDTYNLKIFKDS